jgi:hypothetical protein
MTLDRTTALADCTQAEIDLQKAGSDHLKEAQEAKDAYKAAKNASSHKDYSLLTARFNSLSRTAFTDEVHFHHPCHHLDGRINPHPLRT